jgi:hypothetical protein
MLADEMQDNLAPLRVGSVLIETDALPSPEHQWAIGNRN